MSFANTTNINLEFFFSVLLKRLRIPTFELTKRFVLFHNFKVILILVTSQTPCDEMQILNSTLTPSLYHLIDIPSLYIVALVGQNDVVFVFQNHKIHIQNKQGGHSCITMIKFPQKKVTHIN